MERIILADTDVLSAFAKVHQVPLILSLFHLEQVFVAEGVWVEITYSAKLQRAYALLLQHEYQQNRIKILSPNADEVKFAQSLAPTLSEADRETLAIAKYRGGAILSNERRICYYASIHGVPCFNIPEIISTARLVGMLTKEDTESLVRQLEQKDRIRFSDSALKLMLGED